MPDHQALTAPGVHRQLWRLLSLGRGQWPEVLGGFLFLLLATSMTMTYPYLFRVMLDEVLGARQTSVVDGAALLLIGCLAAYAGASAVRHALFSLAGERFVAKVREQLYERMLMQEAGFWDQQQSGALLSRLSADAALLQNTVSTDLAMLARYGVIGAGATLMLLTLSPPLTLLTLVSVPVALATSLAAGRAVREVSRRSQEALADATAIADETLAGARTVRTSGSEEVEVRRYRHAIQAALRLATRRIVVESGLEGLSAATTTTVVVIVVWGGIRMVLSGALTVGQLASFVLYVMLVASSLTGLAGVWMQLARAVGAADRIFEILDRQPKMPLSGGHRARSLNGSIEISAVTFAYPSRPDVLALDRVSLEIRCGERVALTGPSGSGKSTLAHLLCRLYDPDQGEIRFDGMDLRAYDPTWLRSQLGVVRQDSVLFSTTIAENIGYGRAGATLAEIEEAARTANVLDFIQSLPDGFDTLVGDRGVRLSGGQRQRIAIARAVLRDPRVLILDEATSALDTENEELVTEALDRLMAGRTTLIIAHRLSTMKRADRIVVLDQGRIAQITTYEALVSDRTGPYWRSVAPRLDAVHP